MRELLRNEKLGKFQVTLWATEKMDRRGQTGIAWRVKENGKTVAKSEGPRDYVYGSPMHADDSDAALYSAMVLIAHSATHDDDDRSVDPGWDAEGLGELASMLEEDMNNGNGDDDDDDNDDNDDDDDDEDD